VYRLTTGVALCLLTAAGVARAADPVFENRTPVGFNPADSTVVQDFVSGNSISVRVDLNQAATYEYPVIGHFHAVERSDQLSATDTDGLQIDVAVVQVAPFGTQDNLPAPGVTQAATLTSEVHVAWIGQSASTTGPVFSGGTTAAYEIYYANSDDGGASFSAPVSVSSGLSYYLLSVDGGGTAYSSLDLEVDSGGNPRVAYAFVTTADHSRNANVYLGYSLDGGQSWESPLRLNDVTTVGNTEGRKTAFPRMAIDDRDRIFVAYVRGTTQGAGNDDVMLTKIDHHVTPFAAVPVGSLGTAGSAGGIRLTADGKRHTGPDIAVGDDDALHVVYFSDADNRIEHKRLASDTTWVRVNATGWNQDVDGATVSAFVDEAAGNAALDRDAAFVAPTVVIDRQRLPDRVYSIYKWADGTPNESIGYNLYDDNAAIGGNATWGTAQTAFSTGTTSLFGSGAGEYEVELDWQITDRVAAVVDQRVEGERGDLHIAFTAGVSGGGEHDIYYATYNGTSWTLPEKVADDDADGAGTDDGIAATDTWLLSPALATHPDYESPFLAFGGGSAEGFGAGGVADVNHHPYFKVLGRASTWEDDSRPVGAFEYTLTYTPVNPMTPAAQVNDRLVTVHAADPTDGSGLGATGSTRDGFLAGSWERVGTSLQDTQKRFEGRVDESAGDNREWGDDGDKVGLLLKLNVLGSDSSTNLQVITASSADARAVAVGTAPPVSLAAGAFFVLGADIDIIAANTAPTVSIADPDGTGDTANTSYTIRYDLNDVDDDLSGTLNAAFYVYRSAGLKTVQDIRIFGTLIADQNDVTARNAAGTDDLTEGTNQTYTWDDPPAALQSGSLFASINKVRSGSYYIYLVADDGDNPPVFAVSPGRVNLIHAPVVQSVDPVAADTVDSGVRSGLKANPYDLDFLVVDYDSEARVQLFYSAVNGLSSLSAKGTYPNQSFVLGKSLSGTRGTAITSSTNLSASQTEYSWDITKPVVPQGAYYLYAVASDGASVTLGQSGQSLQVSHSPSLTLYEPARNTQREIDSGSQPVYTIQWQKGRGDEDLDDNASISLYFTTVDPAATNYAGTDSTALTNAGDGNAQLIAGPIAENGDGAADMYVWDFRTSANPPPSGTRVWIYAVISDPSGNVSVVLGGSLLVKHAPHILLETATTDINQGDIVRLEWDDYLVDDGAGTDDAYIRLYASRVAGQTTLSALESSAAKGDGTTFIVNSDDGTPTGTITQLRESGADAFAWDTSTTTFALPEGTYSLYAGIGADATFADNAAGEVSEAPARMAVRSPTGTTPHMLLSPNRLRASPGDTLTFEIYVQTDGETATAVTAALNLPAGLTVLSPTSPFTDAGTVFASGTVLEDTTIGTQLRFSKTGTAQSIGTAQTPAALASFQVSVDAGGSGIIEIDFDDTEAAISLSGRSVPLRGTTGMSTKAARLQHVARGRLRATVMLEGRAPPLGTGNHASLLDVHLRIPGSTMDITDALYLAANDDRPASADTVEVQTTQSGALVLASIPAGRYVLTVRDSSHISGRSDTLTIRDGQTLDLTSELGLFASDIRGDASFLLGQNGRMLKGGDASGDNEIDEDDVNVIDAAWGSDATRPRFAYADLNNDGRVGVEDLAAAISNISSSTGQGAPPVYRRAGLEQAVDDLPEVELPDDVRGLWLHADAETEWLAGRVVDLTVWAPAVESLAAYELEVPVDDAVEVVDSADGVLPGDVFRDNPSGAFHRVTRDGGSITVVGARRGQQWQADGPAALATVRLRLLQDGWPASLAGTKVRLLSADYRARDLGLDAAASQVALPTRFVLGENYPNPFNPATTIPFRLPAVDGRAGVPVRLEVFNALGQRVRALVDGARDPGYYRAQWDGRDDAGRATASGLYFYRLQAGPFHGTGKMLLLE
jgi:hypothetical protein